MTLFFTHTLLAKISSPENSSVIGERIDNLESKPAISVGEENQYQAFIRHAKKTMMVKNEIIVFTKIVEETCDAISKKILIGNIRLYNFRIWNYNTYAATFPWNLFKERKDLPPPRLDKIHEREYLADIELNFCSSVDTTPDVPTE